MRGASEMCLLTAAALYEVFMLFMIADMPLGMFILVELLLLCLFALLVVKGVKEVKILRKEWKKAKQLKAKM